MPSPPFPRGLFRPVLIGLMGYWLTACASGTQDILHALKTTHVVDLSHKFSVDIPHWYGFPPTTRKTVNDYADSGFKAEQYCHVGQWGTHIDPPGHFIQNGRLLDDIQTHEMILPLVVIGVHKQVETNPDYTVKPADILAWEQRHGPVPAGSFVALRTDWSKRWPDQAKMQNADAQGIRHYPGWSKEALVYLYETRGIIASGHETTDTDPGIATTKDDYSLERYILGTGHYQVELLANLDAVPESGAVVVVAWPNVDKGTGFPARVLAIVDDKP